MILENSTEWRTTEGEWKRKFAWLPTTVDGRIRIFRHFYERKIIEELVTNTGGDEKITSLTLIERVETLFDVLKG